MARRDDRSGSSRLDSSHQRTIDVRDSMLETGVLEGWRGARGIEPDAPPGALAIAWVHKNSWRTYKITHKSNFLW